MSESPQTTFGQTTALADAIVTTLNAAQAANTFCLPITAERRFLRKFYLKADGTWTASVPKIGEAVSIEVFAGDELEGRQGGGRTPIFAATYGIHIVLTQHVGAQTETQCPLLMLLRSQIVELLKPLGLAVTAALHPFFPAVLDAVTHSKDDGPYDLNLLAAMNVFSSELILTYKAAV